MILLKIFLAGATGFLGRHVCRALIGKGHEITMLMRSPVAMGCVESGIRVVEGDPVREGAWQHCVAGHDAVINLTGASIFRRWSKKIKEEIYHSRIRSTENIVEAIKSSQEKLVRFFNASGVGYYGHSHDVAVDERSPAGDTFLARVARTWEATAMKAEEAGIKVVLCRFGIVLGKHGGALQRMLPLVTLHLGAPWGCGRKWFSWIHEDDAAEIVSFLLSREDIYGAVNFTSPNPVRNHEVMATLRRALGKKTLIPTMPAWLFRCIFGELAGEFIEGQRALPEVLLKSGFHFRYPSLQDAVGDLTSGFRNKAGITRDRSLNR